MDRRNISYSPTVGLDSVEEEEIRESRTMSSLFRSEPMARCQLILQSEAAYNCVSELGELGLVQFIDLNPDMSSFQRKFVTEVKRCEEMERKLRFLERECIKESVPITEPGEEAPAPPPREMGELESSLSNIERDLEDVNTNYVALKKNEQELRELKYLLVKAEAFLSDTSFQITGGGTSGDEAMHLLEETDDANLVDVPGDDVYRSMKFNIIAGVINRERLLGFERMLWRISKGNVFVKFSDIEEKLEDPGTRDKLLKSVFMVFFQGEELKSRVKKIRDGFHATQYPCPEKAAERREMISSVNTRLGDLATVLKETEELRSRLLLSGSKNLRIWYTKVRKIKAIYHCLNLFNFDVTRKALVGECWIPELDLAQIQEALRRGAELSGSTISPILNSISFSSEPPVFNRTNKYTSGFQALVDAYGVNSYREINPAPFAIATFPFLFAVMFGDWGHGLIIFFVASYMVLFEERLSKINQEIFNMFFGGRYIILAMGIFSLYTGWIYNDCFSKSLNVFGSQWSFRGNVSFPTKLNEGFVTLDPGNRSQYSGVPYYFGIDPIWQSATNKITFLNTYKMKTSLVFGLLHMVFGVVVSVFNHLHFRRYANIFLEFIPQLIFLVFVFCYLIFMMFFKWATYYADNQHPENVYSEHCAPNLLITFINMMLFKEESSDPKLHAICKGRETYMFEGQQMLQRFLVLTGLLMIPVILFGKPIHIMIGRYIRRRNYTEMSSSLEEESLQQQGDGQVENEAFGDIMIFQAIHTIEYVLNCVSHTASYLRLWALSLAHSQLSEVLWNMVMRMGFTIVKGYSGAIVLYFIFAAWAFLTISILVLMEGLSAFLHTLRLHWVEFMSKFYKGQGSPFVPFSFKTFMRHSAMADQEVIKSNEKI